jgi:hypothetical protein
MKIKLIVGVLLGLVLFTSAPIASAANLPMLTWERIKEQNVKLSGLSAQQNWDLQLITSDYAPLNFHKSGKNAKGELVYAVNVPESYPNGLYKVQTMPTPNSPSQVLAGVTVVSLQTPNVVQIPVRLLFLILVLIFLISTLSSMRMRKYEQIQYLRPKPTVELPGIIAAMYRFRSDTLESIKRSLFKFLLIREGELLHKVSPAIWAITPMASFVAGGLLTGTITDKVGGSEHLAITLFVAIALLGVIDPYSGFTACIGFSFVQSILGRVSSVQSIMILLVMAFSWIAPGLISSLYQDLLGKDKYLSVIRSGIPDLVASAMGGFIYLVSDFLLQSLADNSGPIVGHSMKIPLFLGLFIFARINFERFMLRNLHLTGENYQVRILMLPRVVSPRTAFFACAFFSGVLYVWTQAALFAVTIGFALAAPLALLVVRFDLPRLKILANFERHILLESSTICLIAALAMIKIADSPYDVIAKGKLILTTTAVALIVHGVISSIIDTSNRTQAVAPQQMTPQPVAA